MSRATWLALESNPETINAFLEKMGISGLECTDVFSFDEDMLAFVPTPQLAVILCFPSDKAKAYLETVYDDLRKAGSDNNKDVFFMKQKIHNACGTFALFHSLANLEDKIDLGSGPFKEWLEKAKLADEESRSDLLKDDAELASAHAETAQAGETVQPDNVEYHFICYVNKNGTLYEIDSCAPFPRPLGKTTPETLVKDAGVAIMEHVKRIDDPSFSAMALVGQSS